MSLALLDARETEDGMSITFASETWVERIEGSHEQIARLAKVMEQVSVLAPLNVSERVWLEDVVVGDATVRLGLNPGGGARVRIDRR